MQGRGTFEYFGRNGIRHDVIFCVVVLCGVDFVVWCGGVVMVLCCDGVVLWWCYFFGWCCGGVAVTPGNG